jgi:hypothetical protein
MKNKFDGESIPGRDDRALLETAAHRRLPSLRPVR